MDGGLTGLEHSHSFKKLTDDCEQLSKLLKPSAIFVLVFPFGCTLHYKLVLCTPLFLRFYPKAARPPHAQGLLFPCQRRHRARSWA
jgi:hypothetical protein